MYWLQQVQSQKTAPSPQPYTNLQGKQIGMLGLDTSHWKSAITLEDKFQDQLMLIQ